MRKSSASSTQSVLSSEELSKLLAELVHANKLCCAIGLNSCKVIETLGLHNAWTSEYLYQLVDELRINAEMLQKTTDTIAKAATKAKRRAKSRLGAK